MMPAVRKRWKVLPVVLVLLFVVPVRPARAAEKTEPERLIEQLTRDLDGVDRAIDGTRDLIRKSMHRPYLPDLYLRLAELYIQKSRILYHLKRAQNPEASRAVVVLEANLLKTKAIDLYYKILDEFPRYEARDKVLFFMAHEYRELGKYDKMMDCYKRLVKEFPESPYRLETYLLIGDYYFDSMNLDKAEEAYRTILEAPESPVHGMARYKMAWCHINRSRYPEALALLESLAADHRYDDAKTDIDAYKKINLRREALMDLAFCYTEVKPPEEALAYFANLADSKSVYLAVLAKLGQRYSLKENWAAAAAVYRKIISLSHNTEKNTEFAEKLFACAQKADKMQSPEENVRALIKTLEEVDTSWRIPEEEKEKLRKDFEVYARDMATRLHVQAKEKNDKALFSRAADAYAYYLDFFKEGRQARDILQNRAEALYQADRFFDAALAYERLAAGEEGEEGDGASRADYLYSAVASFYKALKNEDHLDDLQKLEAREGLRQAGSRYLADYPKAPEAPEVAFNVAWVSYEQGDYGAAQEKFKAFIQAYPESKEALAAGHLVLDIHKSLDDLDGLIQDARALLANRRITDPTFRKEVKGILAAAEHRHLEELTVKVKDGSEGSEEALLALGREAEDAGLQEMALYNLFVVNKEAGRIPKVLEVGRQLLAKSKDAKHRLDVYATLAHFCFQAADFPNAAGYAEKAAELAPEGERADHLTRAARLRWWMGDPVSSVQDYRKALSSLPAGKRLEVEKGLVEPLEALKNWSEVATVCRGLMEREPGELEWRFRYGNALLEQGQRRQALEVFRDVEARFSKKAASAPDAVGPEEREMAAHARFIRARGEVEAFRRITLRGKKIENTLIQKKLQGLQAVETAGLEVAQYASPRWTIASLLMAADANEGLSRFFLEAPVPKGLTMEQKQQYRRLVEDKARPYREKAVQYRKAALEKAYHLGIFCPEVKVCYRLLNGGDLPAIQRKVGGAAGRGPEAWIERLYADPGNPELLQSLATAYMERGRLELAALVLHRCLEGDAEDARSRNLLGLVSLLRGEDQEAAFEFRKALELDPALDEPRANLVVLNEGYGNHERARELLAEIKDRSVLASERLAVHPAFPAMAGRIEALAMHGSPAAAGGDGE